MKKPAQKNKYFLNLHSKFFTHPFLLSVICYLLSVISLAGLSLGIYHFILPKLTTPKTYAQNTLGPKKGMRWIDTQVNSNGLRDKPIVLRDAYSTHFKNPDGTVTALFTGFKQNAEVSPGVWEPIDYSLEKSTDPRYDYQTKNGVGIYLSKDGSLSQKDLIKVGPPVLGLYNPISNNFKQLKNLNNPKVLKDEVNNSLVLDGKDVKLIVYAYDTGVREDLILENSSPVDNASYNDLLTLKAPITTSGKMTINKQQITDNKFELKPEDSLLLEDNAKTINFPFPQGHDAKDNPAKIRRFLIKEGDVWYLYTSVPANWLKKLSTVYPVTIDPDFTGDNVDSWIQGYHANTYATARSTATNSNPAQGQYNIGQYKSGSAYSVYRSVMTYNTGSIPDQAVINQVNWKNKILGDSSVTDFDVNIVDYDWSAYNPILAGNRDAAFDGCLAGTVDAVWLNTLGKTTGTYYTSPNLSTSWINKTGYTYYCLSSSRDVASTAPSGNEYIITYANESAASSEPYLIITYQPAQVTATAATSVITSSFSANWDSQAGSGANGYTLDVAKDSGFTDFSAPLNTACGGGSCNAKAVGNVTTYSVTSLSAGTTYYYRVRATDSVGGGTGANSNTITVTTIPSAPSSSSATNITTTGFSANWSAATGATGYYLDVATDSGFTTYVATGCGGASCQNKDVGNVTTYAVSGLSAGTTYYYRVRAYNSSGTSSNSNTITVSTLLPAPTANTATSAIEVDSTTSGSGASVSSINWSHTVSGTNRLLVVGVSVRALTTVSTVTYGAQSLTKNGAINFATGDYPRAELWYLIAPNTGSNTITVTLAASDFVEAGAVSFTGVNQTTPLGSFTSNTGTGTAASVNVATDTGNVVLDILTYWSNAADATIGADQTQRWSASSDGAWKTKGSTQTTIETNSGMATMSWTLPAQCGSCQWVMAGVSIIQDDISFTGSWNSVAGATSYKLSVSSSASPNCDGNYVTACGGSSCNLLDIGNVTSYTVTGLSSDNVYYYCLKASNAGGDSINSNVITVNTLPAVPTCNNPTNISTGYAFTTWTNTSSASYRVDLSTDPNFSSFVSNGCNNDSCNNYTVTNYAVSFDHLSSNTNYYYRSRSRSETRGTSKSCPAKSFVTWPGEPSSPVFTSPSTNSLTASWTAPTGNGSLTSYTFDIARNSTFTDILPGYNNVAPAIPTATSQTISNLWGYTTYYLRVRATNATGTSFWTTSNYGTGTTLTGCSNNICNTGTGNTTFSCSCNLGKTTDFVSGGNLTIASGSTLTLDANKILVWEPGRSITVQGAIAVNSTAQLKQGYVIFPDADSDGYPDSITPTIYSSANPSPTGYRSPSQFNSYDTIDCDPSVNTAYSECNSKIVFNTQGAHNGDFDTVLPGNGLSEADDYCNSQAQQGGLPGTYKAWLSDSTTDAKDRITPHPYKYTLPNGTLVAYNFQHFLSPTPGILHAIDMTQYATTNNQIVWTNTKTDGTKKSASSTCSDWNASDATTVSTGRTDFTNTSWTDAVTRACGTTQQLYCFQQ